MPSYADRILATLRQCVRLTPASWTQFMAELSEDTDAAGILWHRIADTAGVELRSAVKREVLINVAAEAEQEFAAALHNARSAAARLAQQAAR